MITIDEITIVVDGREIIYDYSEQIPAGSITVIVGPNGCGKSTLLAAIAGDIAPDKGTITIDEHHPILTPADTLAGIRSMVVQNQSFVLGFTVRQVIEMAGDSAHVMKALELTEIADRLVTTLSGGEAQRLKLAGFLADAATSSTALSKAASLARDGTEKPLNLRTNCSDASRISNSVAGGSKLNRVLMLRHMAQGALAVGGDLRLKHSCPARGWPSSRRSPAVRKCVRGRFSRRGRSS